MDAGICCSPHNALCTYFIIKKIIEHIGAMYLDKISQACSFDALNNLMKHLPSADKEYEAQETGVTSRVTRAVSGRGAV